MKKTQKGRIAMEIKSLLIKDTTKEERIRIVQEGLNQCGGACDFCNGCDNLGGGSVDAFYEPYINGEKELRQLNEEYKSNCGMVKQVEIMRAPEIEASTEEERRQYIKETFPCIADCDMCGLCTVFKGKDPELAYAYYIKGIRSYLEVSGDYR